MLVSHRHKFIYTKTVKTGGSSVESYFERFCFPENEYVIHRGGKEYISDTGIVGYRGVKRRPINCKYWNHMPAKKIRRKLGKDIWDEYFKFCVLRNPFNKVISAFYFYKHLNSINIDLNNMEKERMEFENWLSDTSHLPIDREAYTLRSIGGIDRNICVDDVIRYESMKIDLERICNRLDIPWDETMLPYLKSGITPKNIKPEIIFTDKSRKIVETAFKYELDYFRYSFPD